MKGMFSLIITIALGYMLWSYLAPPLKPYLPSVGGARPSISVANAVQPLVNQARNLVQR